MARAAHLSKLFERSAIVLEMIKFQHTIFALPFALIGMLVAAAGLPPFWKVFWIVMACVFARTAAMSFNRWADAELDARNPRTADRALPAGQLNRSFVLATAMVAAGLFTLSAGMLNLLALILSPVALLVLLGYSYCKRFTMLSHLVLGLALGIAPTGAWIAVRGSVEVTPLFLSAAVVAWTAGFDIIYACQDLDVDRREGLYSIPAKLGVIQALYIARLLHVCTVALLVIFGAAAHLHWPYLAGVAAAGSLLLAQHLIVSPQDLSRIHIAFFKINSWVGVVLFAAVLSDLLIYE